MPLLTLSLAIESAAVWILFQIAVELIPQEFMDVYGLHDKVKNGYVYCEIVRGMYGLPQAGI